MTSFKTFLTPITVAAYDFIQENALKTGSADGKISAVEFINTLTPAEDAKARNGTRRVIICVLKKTIGSTSETQRITLTMCMGIDAWTVVSATVHAMNRSGVILPDSIVRLKSETPTECSMSKRQKLPEGHWLGKVVSIRDVNTLVVEHSLGKRVVTIPEGTTFVCAKNRLGRPRKHSKPIFVGDTIIYTAPSGPAVGNYTLISLARS